MSITSRIELFKLTAPGIHAVEDKIGGGKGDTQKKATDAGREQLEQTGYDFWTLIEGYR